VTSGDCNECIAENQVGFCYELVMRGNEKTVNVFEPLCIEKYCFGRLYSHVPTAGEKQNIFHLYYQSSLQPQYCDRLCSFW